MCAWVRALGGLFDKDGDELGLTVIKNLEVFLFQARDSVVMLVMHDDVDLNQFGSDANG